MTASREQESLARVLGHEGGYSNHPADPGGATMKGVTQRVYDAYRRSKGLAVRSVKSTTSQELFEIYDRQYWDAVKGDQLPAGVDYVLFDGAVNSGPKQSIMWLQRALGPLYQGRVDGVMGLGTIAAVQACNNHDALIDHICDQRLAFLQHLKTWRVFGTGWGSRVAEVRSIGQAWATGAMPQIANFVDGGQAKAFVEDAKAAPSIAPADAAAGGGVAGIGVSGTLAELQNQLSPFSYASEWIGKVVVILALVSAVMAIGGLAYGWYARRKAARIADALGTAS
ncbi:MULTISPECIES: glycoside hydrolase family 108 protein [unclassified Mesorhizobium]|uniref:glycoside hydrolase family 108 protein n=1 Tax=unclassified Mesorhizobium TaxID=325217 RepID=UPI002416CC7E|nr:MULTISPECIES: glycoside hydrolase family 108 protein [unclassified Mesorhizobium]MDG4900564.1 glycoside hydrolase family 108 protein [Mesorhizobium sp. WSM4962]MDG4917199.1 glycoside hydrolase family 108 protein [Mesorhizobium sp. WSM4989]